MKRIDVCIICALAEEATAFKKVLEKQGAEFQTNYSQQQKRDYFATTISNDRGNTLSLILIWQVRVGMQDASSTIEKVLQEFEPRFLAMTGFCGGNKSQVKIGDLIVADKTFIYDNGSVIENKEGKKEFQFDPITFQMHSNILQSLRTFTDWESIAETLKQERPISKHQQGDWLLNQLLERQTTLYQLSKEELTQNAPNWREILGELLKEEPPLLDKETLALRDPEDFKRSIWLSPDDFPYKDAEHPKCYIGSLGSGNAVRKDNPFPELEKLQRKLLGLDMEGAAIYYALQERPQISFLVAKGVSDYADGSKDYHYHGYAAALSAAYVSAVISHYVNDEYMPWPDDPQKATNKHQTQSSTEASPQSPQTQTTQITGTTKSPVKIFFSHSQSSEDQKLIEALSTHLSVLKRGNPPLIEEWDRHDIEAGDTQDEEIKKKLDEAQIILLMISPDYYNSPFYPEEIKQVEQRRLKGTRVIPILLRPTDYWKEAFSHGALRSLPDDDNAITQWRNRDEALLNITRAIRRVVEKLQNS